MSLYFNDEGREITEEEYYNIEEEKEIIIEEKEDLLNYFFEVYKDLTDDEDFKTLFVELTHQEFLKFCFNSGFVDTKRLLKYIK